MMGRGADEVAARAGSRQDVVDWAQGPPIPSIWEFALLQADATTSSVSR